MMNQGNRTLRRKKRQRYKKKRVRKNQLNLNPKVLEYGSKLAEIQDFAIRDKSGMITNVIEKGEEFSVDMKIHFHETIQEPIFAFTIKDLKGTEITGTNTMYENTPVGTTEGGRNQTDHLYTEDAVRGRRIYAVSGMYRLPGW